MSAILPLAALFFGYLLGSISFSLLLAKARGIELREVGSGNLGATNAGRALGKGGGVLVLFLDALKAWLPAWLASWVGTQAGLSPQEASIMALAAAFGAYLGHIWPVYFGFRGGKGVATLIGGALFFAPVVLLGSLLVLIPVVLITRWMSAGSLVLGFSLPLVAYQQSVETPVLIYFSLAGLFLFWTHRENLSRILSGTERRLGDKNK